MSRTGRLAAALAASRYSRKVLADGSGVVLDLEGLQVLSLNASGMFLLEAIADGAADDELVARLIARFEVDEATAREDVEQFAKELDCSLGDD